MNWALIGNCRKLRWEVWSTHCAKEKGVQKAQTIQKVAQAHNMMEGFGSIDGATYNYGSVEDGYIQNPTLEQRLKKKYWKTKQTVITKLKREEDEHVVAGDADIDIKLEVIVYVHNVK